MFKDTRQILHSMAGTENRRKHYNCKTPEHHWLVAWPKAVTQKVVNSLKELSEAEEEKKLYLVCVSSAGLELELQGLCFPCELKKMSAGTPASAQPPPPLPARPGC